ncbi:MAG: hypothetical protein A2270_10185 [Elusimicrobia bacterium RIFOXYA12_FULL_51_18]|nr:MAG: hypothetical protein A2270_10185 [Elusimicrobia bacterium RIFOXYA12_FULL_51_18]
MNKFFLLGFLLMFSACAMPQAGMKTGRRIGALGAIAQPAQQPQQYFVDETVEVITDPPGARIQINDAFAGYSPLKAPVRRMWRGDPRYPMTLDTVKIEALPVAGGQCVQSGIFGQNSGRTPPQVSFNMTACSVPAPAPAAPTPAPTGVE